MDMEGLDPDQKKKYLSGAGMLLYVAKYSRPDFSNVVRELPKYKK
jgi:hypothetical protein